MSAIADPDVFVSVLVAAELCSVPVIRVLSFLENQTIRRLKIQGQQLVSLREVEQAIKEGRQDDPSL